MTIEIVLAMIVLPIVVAFRQLALDFGYRGLAWHVACDRAWNVGLFVVLLVAGIVAFLGTRP